jgi:hypothetical protein
MERLNNRVLKFNDFDKLRLNEEEEAKKEELSGYGNLYLRFLEKMNVCFQNFRLCVPGDLPPDVKKRKPALVEIINDFNSFASLKNVYSGIKEDSGEESHKAMWDTFEASGEKLKNKVREFYQIYAAKPEEPERGESETRTELQDRIRTGSADAKDAFLAANTEAAEYVDSAVKIFTKGAKNILDSLKEADFKAANQAILAVEKKLKKVNENINEKKDPEKKSKKHVANYKEITYLSLFDTYSSIYKQILDIRDYYKNTEFYSEIEKDITEYLGKTKIKEGYDFLKGIRSKPEQVETENRKKMEELADKAADILSQEKDISLYKWRKGIDEKIGDRSRTDETIKSGDAKIEKARQLISNMIELANAKEKAAARELDNLVDNLTSGFAPKKDRIAGEGVTVIDPDSGEITKAGREALNNKITDLIGAKEPNIDKDGQGENVLDLAYRLSFFSGNDYKDKDGKIDVEKLYKDLDIFTKDVVGNKAFTKFILNF